MNWKQWYNWKNRRLITAILFIIAYILTIPIRNYEFLSGLTDISQGVPLWAHLIVIAAGVIVLLILMKILEVIVKKYILKK